MLITFIFINCVLLIKENNKSIFFQSMRNKEINFSNSLNDIIFLNE